MTQDTITIEKHLRHTSARPSGNAMRVAAMFGLDLDHAATQPLIPRTTLTLFDQGHGRIIYITGPSGSGKSTILHCIADEVHPQHEAGHHANVRIVHFNRPPRWPNAALVDMFPALTLDQTLRILSRAGLNDALTLLRTPGQLSDGQRYRLRLARIMATLERTRPHRRFIILADEFAAVLDHLTAQIVARNIAKWIRQQRNISFIAATTHDDLAEALDADVIIEKQLGSGLHRVDRCAT